MAIQKFIKGIKIECSAIKKIRTRDGDDEFKKISQDLLMKFIGDVALVDKVIESDFLLWECAVLFEMRDDIWFQDKCMLLMDRFNSAKQNSAKKVKRSLTKWFEKIHDAHVNYSEIFHIENIDDSILPRLYVKQAFRQLGDMLEGSFSTYVRQVYDLLQIIHDDKLLNSSKTSSFGQLVADLCNILEFRDFYKASLFNVPISQWRNISQHIDYNFNQDTNLIDCWYGPSSKRKYISLSLDSLSRLMAKCNSIYIIHKICLTMFSLKNRHLLDISNFEKYIDDDTLSSTILAIFESNGFEISSFSNSGFPWKITVINSFGKEFYEFRDVAKKVSTATALRKDVSIFMELRNINDEIIIQGFTVK